MSEVLRRGAKGGECGCLNQSHHAADILCAPWVRPLGACSLISLARYAETIVNARGSARKPPAIQPSQCRIKGESMVLSFIVLKPITFAMCASKCCLLLTTNLLHQIQQGSHQPPSSSPPINPSDNVLYPHHHSSRSLNPHSSSTISLPNFSTSSRLPPPISPSPHEMLGVLLLQFLIMAMCNILRQLAGLPLLFGFP